LGEIIRMKNEMKKHKPTHVWRQRKEENDPNYTEEIINSMDVILDQYIFQLSQLVNPSEEDIMKCVKDVVLAINDWDMKHDFIKRIEREELHYFIDITAEIKGLNEPVEDITEEWREW
jgi:hypothetical protein